MYVCDAYLGFPVEATSHAAPLTYISPFSNLFLRLSLIASFEILLMSVRSDTPTSFFLVDSKTAFRTCGLPAPEPLPV